MYSSINIAFDLTLAVVTIGLLSLSYVINAVRIGTLVLIIHDPSDVLLELAKCCDYSKRERLKDLVFIVFAVVWTSTRVIAFAYVILYSTVFLSLQFTDPFPGYVLFNSLLVVLYLLQLYWTYLIVDMTIHTIRSGGQWKDGRSDTEDESSHNDTVACDGGASSKK